MSDEPKTVGEAMEAFCRIELRRAVFEQLSEHLALFIATDTHQPKQGISSPIKPYDVVPQDTISDVLVEIKDVCSALQDEADKLQRLGLMTKERRTSAKKKKKTVNRKAKNPAGAPRKKQRRVASQRDRSAGTERGEPVAG